MPYIDIDNETLFYTESRSSEKPVLLLIHGSGGSHRHWPEGLRRLAGASVYAVDLPGHGRSGGKSRSDVNAYAHVIDGFVRQLGLRGVVLAGHSLGGAIAQIIALQSPQWLSRIVLLGTGSRLRVLPEVLDGLLTDYENAIGRMVDKMFGPDAASSMVQGERQIYFGMSPTITHDDYNACDAFDVSDQLGGIQFPVLVISGSEDNLTPVKYGEYLHCHIPGSQLAVVDRAGHMMALEKTEAVVDLFRAFIKD